MRKNNLLFILNNRLHILNDKLEKFSLQFKDRLNVVVGIFSNNISKYMKPLTKTKIKSDNKLKIFNQTYLLFNRTNVIRYLINLKQRPK